MNHKDTGQVLPIVIKAAKEYEEKLNNHHFMIVYQNKNVICTCCVGFRDMNYLHLTGLKTKLSAQLFYSACLSGKLSVRDIEVDTKGKIQQKLAVLPYLSELLYHNCMIGEFVNSGIMIKADYFVGDTKAVLSVGFRHGKAADIPVTLYKESVKKLSNPTCKILAIFRKSYRSDKYEQCTYLSRGYHIDKLSEEIKSQLEEKLLCALNEDVADAKTAPAQKAA